MSAGLPETCIGRLSSPAQQTLKGSKLTMELYWDAPKSGSFGGSAGDIALGWLLCDEGVFPLDTEAPPRSPTRISAPASASHRSRWASGT